MSHSQFHSTKSFILRHAWLNLRDERMTTGRINQIAIPTEGTQSLLQSRLDLSIKPRALALFANSLE